jgi:hypothetical protein
MLHEHASLLRGALEHGWPEELLTLDAPSHRAWVTGGPSLGEPPSRLVDPCLYLAGAGILQAAGFETEAGGQGLVEFSDDELRLVHIGVTAAHLAAAAAGTKLDGDERHARAARRLAAGDPEQRARALAAAADVGGLKADADEQDLYDALVTLAARYGGDVARLFETPPRAIASDPPPPPRHSVPLDQRLAVVLADELDFNVANSHDLAVLRRLAEDTYHRFATWDTVGEHRLYVAAPHGGPEDDVAVSIGRLGRAGILDAAGALAWSAPG